MGCMRSSISLALLCLTAAALLTACDSPTEPRVPAIVTFAVGSETFRVQLNTAAQVEAAEAARRGTGPRIPNGRIVAGTGVNTGWSWHLEEVEFADVTIEICDGRPSDVEREGTSFGGGRYCPWSARVVAIDGAR